MAADQGHGWPMRMDVPLPYLTLPYLTLPYLQACACFPEPPTCKSVLRRSREICMHVHGSEVPYSRMVGRIVLHGSEATAYRSLIFLFGLSNVFTYDLINISKTREIRRRTYVILRTSMACRPFYHLIMCTLPLLSPARSLAVPGTSHCPHHRTRAELDIIAGAIRGYVCSGSSKSKSKRSALTIMPALVALFARIHRDLDDFRRLPPCRASIPCSPVT